MIDQTLLNWLLAGLGTILGFLMKQLWQAVKDLQSADTALTDRVSKVEVLVAGNYVSKNELKDLSSALFKKLDRIEDHLDKKADK